MDQYHEEQALKAILDVLQRTQETAENNSLLLMNLVAENIAIKDLLQQIADNTNPKPLTASIAIRFTGDSVMANNVLVLNVGQTSTASIVPFLADGVTPSGGTLSAVSYTFSDPSATVVLNPDGVTALVTGVAASAGAITGSAAATVTDTDGVVSKWTQPFTITTNGVVPPAQLTQSVAVQFTTPA
jgi:hypothetical protein